MLSKTDVKSEEACLPALLQLTDTQSLAEGYGITVPDKFAGAGGLF